MRHVQVLRTAVIALTFTCLQDAALSDPLVPHGGFEITYKYKGSLPKLGKSLDGVVVIGGDQKRLFIRATQNGNGRQRTVIVLDPDFGVTIQGDPQEPIATLSTGINPAWQWDHALPLLPVNYPAWRQLRDVVSDSNLGTKLQVPFMVAAGGPKDPLYRPAKAFGVTGSTFEPTSIAVGVSSSYEEAWQYSGYRNTDIGIRLPSRIDYAAPGGVNGGGEAKVSYDLVKAEAKAPPETAFLPETYIGIGVNVVDVRPVDPRTLLYDPARGSFREQAMGKGLFEPILKEPDRFWERVAWTIGGAIAGICVAILFLKLRARSKKRLLAG